MNTAWSIPRWLTNNNKRRECQVGSFYARDQMEAWRAEWDCIERLAELRTGKRNMKVVSFSCK